jgi:hypothetical protein
MTRGKNAAATAARARADAGEFEARARHAEQESRALASVVAERDREIERLRDALIQSRHEHTLPGTYTEADVAIIRSESITKHRRAVEAGFAYLAERDAVRVPVDGGFNALAEAFACEPADILSAAGSTERWMRRITKRDVNIRGEARDLERRGLI